jgi:uncharacterized phage infection (PIP) family protein YhgE
MQLVVARVAAAAAVASEVSSRTALEATKQSAEDRVTSTQAAATTTTEWDSLAMRLAQAEAEIEELRATVATANNTTEKATTATAIAWDATQTTAQEKTTLEAKVAELDHDLGTTGSDLRTVNQHFSEVTNRLQVVSDEVTRLWEVNSKLCKTSPLRFDASICNFLSSPMLTCFLAVSGLRAYHVGMTVKLTEKTQELNAALLKIIEKDNSIKRLLEQLESKPFTLIPISPFF